jgi:signal peptidase I
MAPTLRHGDVVLALLGGAARPGDVVLVELPARGPAVKRLVRRGPDGRVWVEGDNPFASTDSRALGALPGDALRARVVARLWPRPRLLRR